MYDMYPEWGPAHLDDDYPNACGGGNAAAEAADRRDSGGQRTDDN